jgi:hypothetical protein
MRNGGAEIFRNGLTQVGQRLADAEVHTGTASR